MDGAVAHTDVRNVAFDQGINFGCDPNDLMNKRVLVVDDTPDCSIPLAKLLRRRQFDVTIAVDGAQALAMLDDAAPDVIVLDLHMPVMDGYAFLEAIHKAGRTTAVIVMTADYEPDRRRLANDNVKKIRMKGLTSFETLLGDIRHYSGLPS